MLTFLLHRTLQAIPTLFLASLLIFFSLHSAPGDFLTPAKLNPNISAEQLTALQRNFGLNLHPIEQYFIWMRNMVFHLDFGLSFLYLHQDVIEIMTPRIINSFYLVLLNLVFFMPSRFRWASSAPCGRTHSAITPSIRRSISSWDFRAFFWR